MGRGKQIFRDCRTDERFGPMMAEEPIVRRATPMNIRFRIEESP